MNTNLTNELFCSTFGHNFYQSKSLSHSSDELTCKHCNLKVVNHIDNDLDDSTYPKKEFGLLLNQLYSLKRVLFSKKLSLK